MTYQRDMAQAQFQKRAVSIGYEANFVGCQLIRLSNCSIHKT